MTNKPMGCNHRLNDNICFPIDL